MATPPPVQLISDHGLDDGLYATYAGARSEVRYDGRYPWDGKKE